MASSPLIPFFLRQLILSSILTFFFVVIVSGQSSRHGHLSKSTFGEPCNKTLRCKSQSWFTCDYEQGTCQCSKPDEMIYDETKDKCVSMIGEACKFQFEDPERFDRALVETSECVEGAECNSKGICLCPSGYYEDLHEGKCYEAREIFETCTLPYECNPMAFLTCINATCKCNPETSVFNPTQFYDRSTGSYKSDNACLSKVGNNCRNNQQLCTKNAVCDTQNDIAKSVCKCTSGYTETSQKLCGLGYDMSCSTTSICSDKLRCVGTPDIQSCQSCASLKCKCPNEKYQSYDPQTMSCRGVVGAPCDPQETNGCTRNASCIQRDGMFQCECGEGFIDSEEGRCDIKHGYPCDYDVEIISRCDELPDLVCLKGVCQCIDEVDVYEAKKRRCLSPVGVRCRNSGDCVEHTNCLKIDNENIWGRCSCLDGFTITQNHTCVELIEDEIMSELENTTENDLN